MYRSTRYTVHGDGAQVLGSGLYLLSAFRDPFAISAVRSFSLPAYRISGHTTSPSIPVSVISRVSFTRVSVCRTFNV